MVLTAVATPDVILDVVNTLNISGSILFKASIVRKSLRYEVRMKKSLYETVNEIYDLINGWYKSK